LLLEGRDLEELLAQVRDEHGPDAKIVSAEKVRTGGIGGLFGSPKYELTVEIQDSAPSAEPTAPAVGSLTLEDLAAMADAAERTSEDSAGTAFAEMLAEATPEKSGTAAEALQQLLAGEERTPPVRPFRPAAGQHVAKLGMKPIGEVEPTPTRQETAMPVEVSEAVATIDRPRTADSSERLAATYGSPAAAPPRERTAEQRVLERSNGAERSGSLPRRLQALGVPTDVAFRATATDTYAALVEAFGTLPVAEPAPDGPGETLVVIGESTHAVEVARHVAGTLRLDPDEILFAGRNALAAGVSGKRRIASSHDARGWAKRLRKSDSPSLVAIEAALDESSWAASIVEAVRPAAVWVVVDASRKTSDVAHHLQGLRRVDAIALRSTLSSGDPASALSLRMPVALLDGRPPTPYAWAAMLCERLSIVGS
jgi:hypothetical protein